MYRLVVVFQSIRQRFPSRSPMALGERAQFGLTDDILEARERLVSAANIYVAQDGVRRGFTRFVRTIFELIGSRMSS